MNLQISPKEEPEINLTSLIDVVLLLLVFFMVSTSFVREAELSLILPQAQTEPNARVSQIDALEISITKDGSYLINGNLLSNSERETLSSVIEELMGDNFDSPVFIRADGLATHQSVVTVMDVLAKLGLVEINVSTLTLPEP
ncbi:MAG: biopolymer transporter ExbD [Rhodospirillaceae bacterium]|nr:biopolymer transporter ExbD [Rhodospirillaceae bacterium]|tara:strand:- start:475 stop:900 length:426 start_codon:yes stop_codon:yes gene_type:complete